MNQELPLDLAHLDDLRERIIQADEAIVSFVCLRVQLAREELAYRRERGLPEVDKNFEHRERHNIRRAILNHAHPLKDPFELGWFVTETARSESGAVDDGRYDPATGDLGF